MRRFVRRLVTLLLISLLLFSVSSMLHSVIACKPPKIVSVTRSPETPNYDQSVTIEAQVIPEGNDIESVILRYNLNCTGWINVTMSLEDPEDGIYVAEIPSQPYSTTVCYKVYAYDTQGRYSCSDYYDYVVYDFVPPVISDVQVPTSPLPYETVIVSANVTEPPEASGVKNVTLRYTTDDTWSFLDMAMQDGLWTATIPGQNEGVNVRFFVEAFDNAGNSAATSIFDYTVIIPNDPPVADFSESASTVYTGEVIYFDASDSYDPDGYITSYFWDFGDGNTGNGVTVEHAYVDDGSYTVTLTVTDNEGATDTANATKTVLTPIIPNKKPVAAFTESAEIVHTGEGIFFDASGSYDPDGTIIAHLWDFGDGDTAVGVEVDHAYEDDGTYTVTLTVIDNNGATDSSTSTKNVLNRPPLALFTENATTVSTWEVIHFDASGSYDPDGSIISYHWDFGDGNTTTGITSTHAYSEDGNYTVTLTITDDDGASTSESAMKIVETEEEMSNGVLSLSFLAAICLGVAALTVTLLYGLLIRRKKKGRTDIFSYLSH